MPDFVLIPTEDFKNYQSTFSIQLQELKKKDL